MALSVALLVSTAKQSNLPAACTSLDLISMIAVPVTDKYHMGKPILEHMGRVSYQHPRRSIVRKDKNWSTEK